MGRKAKLKKEKKRVKTNLPQPANPNQFVQEMERKGYSLKTGKHSPDLPDSKPKPQL